MRRLTRYRVTIAVGLLAASCTADAGSSPGGSGKAASSVLTI